MQDAEILTRAFRRADCQRCDGVLFRMDTCRDNGVSSVSSLPLRRVLCLACNASLVKAQLSAVCFIYYRVCVLYYTLFEILLMF